MTFERLNLYASVRNSPAKILCKGKEAYPDVPVTAIECDTCGDMLYNVGCDDGLMRQYYHDGSNNADICVPCFRFFEALEKKTSLDIASREFADILANHLAAKPCSVLSDGLSAETKCFMCDRTQAESAADVTMIRHGWVGNWCESCYMACRFIKANLAVGNKFLFRWATNLLSTQAIWDLTPEQASDLIRKERARRGID